MSSGAGLMRVLKFVLAAALAMTAILAARAADEWHTFRSPENRFALEFPKAPVPRQQRLDPEKTLSDIQYWADLGHTGFGVSAAHFHHRIIAAQPPAKQIDGVIERVGASLQCKVRGQREVAV